MDALKNLSQLASAILLGICLTSCAALHKPATPTTYSLPKNTSTIADANIGMNKRATIGDTSVGLFSNRPTTLLKHLAANGVQVIALGDTLKLIIPSDSCFRFGTSDLTEHCSANLKTITALLEMTGNAPIRVMAYGDNSMEESITQRLTQEEVDSVVAFLWAHGISNERFYARGQGSADPIASNYTISGNGLNRRVEISLGGDAND